MKRFLSNDKAKQWAQANLDPELVARATKFLVEITQETQRYIGNRGGTKFSEFKRSVEDLLLEVDEADCKLYIGSESDYEDGHYGYVSIDTYEVLDPAEIEIRIARVKKRYEEMLTKNETANANIKKLLEE